MTTLPATKCPAWCRVRGEHEAHEGAPTRLPARDTAGGLCWIYVSPLGLDRLDEVRIETSGGGGVVLPASTITSLAQLTNFVWETAE